MKINKKVILLILIPVLLLAFFMMFNDSNSNKDLTDIKYILSTEEYSYLPKAAQRYIEDVYNETGEIILTEKNKQENMPYLNPSYIKYLSLSDEEKENVELIPRAEIIDYNGFKLDGLEATSESYYNLRNVNGKSYVSTSRDQGLSGICWAFASAETLETHLMFRDDISFSSGNATLISERQLDYATSNNGIIDYENEYNTFINRKVGRGGNFVNAITAFGSGVSAFEYSEFSSDLTDDDPMELSEVLNRGKSLYELDGAINLPMLNVKGNPSDAAIRDDYVELVKTLIKLYGGAYVGTTSPQSGCAYYDSGARNYVIDQDASCDEGGHAMQIIGWDDNVEYSYCTSDPSKHKPLTSSCPTNKRVKGKGVWILRNSWGAGDPYEFPYLAYDSSEVDIYFITEVSDMSERNWDNNYVISEGRENYIYRARNFPLYGTTIKGQEKLSKIKFFAYNVGAKYTISILNENGSTIKEYKDLEVVVPGLYTLDISTDNINVTNKNYIRIESSTGKFYGIIYVFTENNDTAPYLDTEMETIFGTSSRLYSTTKNIDSDEVISYKVYDSRGTNITSKFNFTNNSVAENNVNTLMSVNTSIPNEVYRFEALYNGTVLDIFETEIYDITTLEGEGTESSPYIIDSPDKLYMLNAKQINDKYFELGADIDLSTETRSGGKFYNSGKGWKPIEGFSGYLDGKGHKITGLYFNDTFTTSSNVGLFSDLSNGASISNLVLEDFDIKCYKNCGALVGEVYSIESEEELLINNVAIRNSKIIGVSDDIGSLIGRVYVSGDKKLRVNVDSIFSDSVVKGASYVGGIIGINYGYTNYSNIEFLGTVSSTKIRGIGSIIGHSNNSTLENIISNVTDRNLVGETIDGNTIRNALYLSSIGSSTGTIRVIDINSSDYYNGKFADLNTYSGWNSFSTYWSINNHDGKKRLPILKFVNDFEYLTVDNVIEIDTTGNPSVNIYDYIHPNKEILKGKLKFEGIEVDDNGVIDYSSLDSYENTFRVLNYYDGGIYSDLVIRLEAESFVINFDANGGNGVMEPFTASVGLKKELPANTFTKSKYEFDSWNTEADGSGTSYRDMEKTIIDNNGNDEITLYAQWIGERKNITFNVNGGITWTNSSCGFVYSNGTCQKVVRHEESFGDLPTPIRKGYAFVGWYTEIEAGELINKDTEFDSSMATTLYARWQEITYTIRYDANGGVGEMEDQTMVVGGKLRKNTFTKEKYVFSKWNTKADGTGTSYRNEADVVGLATRNGEIVTLYAIWEVDYVYKTTKYSVNANKKYIDLIPYDTTVATFKKNFTVNTMYDLKVDTKGNTYIGTGTKVQILDNGKVVMEFTCIVRGDINGDSKISALDYVQIKNHIMDTKKITKEIDILAADANNDGKISALDYVKIKNIIMAR